MTLPLPTPGGRYLYAGTAYASPTEAAIVRRFHGRDGQILDRVTGEVVE